MEWKNIWLACAKPWVQSPVLGQSKCLVLNNFIILKLGPRESEYSQWKAGCVLMRQVINYTFKPPNLNNPASFWELFSQHLGPSLSMILACLPILESAPRLLGAEPFAASTYTLYTPLPFSAAFSTACCWKSCSVSLGPEIPYFIHPPFLIPPSILSDCYKIPCSHYRFWLFVDMCLTHLKTSHNSLPITSLKCILMKLLNSERRTYSF